MVDSRSRKMQKGAHMRRFLLPCSVTLALLLAACKSWNSEMGES